MSFHKNQFAKNKNDLFEVSVGFEFLNIDEKSEVSKVIKRFKKEQKIIKSNKVKAVSFSTPRKRWELAEK